jgi:hypothetical protein
MDNATKRQSKRVNEPAVAPAAPGRDVLLALATAWSSSHGLPRAGALPAVAAPSAPPRTFPAGHVARWWARSR